MLLRVAKGGDMKKKFKEGDKVKIIRISGKMGHHFKIGEIVTIQEIDNTDNTFLGVNKGRDQWVPFEDVREVADRIIFRDNTTILFKDGKKYIAKCCDGDTYDKEKGLLVCLAKAHGYTFNDLQEMLKGAEVQTNKYKIKLSSFLKNKGANVAIHTSTIEQFNKLAKICKEKGCFHFMNENTFNAHKERTCISRIFNYGYSDIGFYKGCGCEIYEFDEVDLNN